MRSLRKAVEQMYGMAPYVPAHDIKHTLRVAALARQIADGEDVDPDQAEAGALIHDIGRLQAKEEGHDKAGHEEKYCLLREHTD